MRRSGACPSISRRLTQTLHLSRSPERTRKGRGGGRDQVQRSARRGILIQRAVRLHSLQPALRYKDRGPQAQSAWKALGAVWKRLDAWSLFALSPDPRFERIFGRKADRKRKLYNATIECNLYQYLGPLPR